MKKDVSASIVVYENNPEDVVNAIRSVLSASMGVTCTVVDNSPTTALMTCVEENGAKYIHVGRNIGFGSGHNVVMREANEPSEYHLVLNPDVRFLPEVLITLYRFMNDNQQVGLVMPKILHPDGTEQRLCKQLPSPLDLVTRRFLGGIGRQLFAGQLSRYELRSLDLRVAREVPCLSGCFMFLRSKTLREVGLFDERFFMYMEDVDLCRRIGERYKTIFYPWVAVTHGYAKGSYSNRTLLKYHVKSAIRYFGKWGWIYDSERRMLNRNTLPVSGGRATRESVA